MPGKKIIDASLPDILSDHLCSTICNGNLFIASKTNLSAGPNNIPRKYFNLKFWFFLSAILQGDNVINAGTVHDRAQFSQHKFTARKNSVAWKHRNGIDNIALMG